MTKVGIIVASHGKMADETLKSLAMIAGSSIENFEAVSVVEGMDYDAALSDMKQKFERLDRSNGVIIITDIYGGTPANIATNIAIENDNVFVFSGLNLPIILEIIYQRETKAKALAQTINDMMPYIMVNITDKLLEVNNGNQDDSY